MRIEGKVEAVRCAAERVTRLWQQVLRLEDWDVEVELVRHYDLSKDCSGTMQTFAGKKRAVMQLIDPRDTDPRWRFDMGMEFTIVHELLHIHLEPLLNRDVEHIATAEERAVHAISVALVKAAAVR